MEGVQVVGNSHASVRVQQPLLLYTRSPATYIFQPDFRSQSCYKTAKPQRSNTHPFNDPLSRTTWVSRYQNGKTNLDFTQARDTEWQWHQLGHVQVCTSLQTDNHASTPPLIFTGRMPFLLPNQQRQSTEGKEVSK